MAKPILVINYCIEGMPMTLAVRNLRELQKVVSESDTQDEYYTFLLPVTADSNIQVFYDKDFKETQYKELKDMIEAKMKFFQERSNSDLINQEYFEQFSVEENNSWWQRFKSKFF